WTGVRPGARRITTPGVTIDQPCRELAGITFVTEKQSATHARSPGKPRGRPRHDIWVGRIRRPSSLTRAPQNPHKSGSALASPTESPRTIRHFPAQSGTDARVEADGQRIPDSPLCRSKG